jgi:hypothetical protein
LRAIKKSQNTEAQIVVENRMDVARHSHAVPVDRLKWIDWTKQSYIQG